mmetsp:Transcript_22732/g.40715  ORF Transcript_22732/g.40715 Transcript_22732/m.40715 type:complete len:260 (-) Transcript_22732:341-1120(-)
MARFLELNTQPILLPIRHLRPTIPAIPTTIRRHVRQTRQNIQLGQQHARPLQHRHVRRSHHHALRDNAPLLLLVLFHQILLFGSELFQAFGGEVDAVFEDAVDLDAGLIFEEFGVVGVDESKLPYAGSVAVGVDIFHFNLIVAVSADLRPEVVHVGVDIFQLFIDPVEFVLYVVEFVAQVGLDDEVARCSVKVKDPFGEIHGHLQFSCRSGQAIVGRAKGTLFICSLRIFFLFLALLLFLAIQQSCHHIQQRRQTFIHQ